MPTTTDKPTVERRAVLQLRRWCPYAKTHQDAEDGQCEWEYCDGDRPYHLLRLRRMFVCSIKGCEQGYFSRAEFDSHVCFSAY